MMTNDLIVHAQCSLLSSAGTLCSPMTDDDDLQRPNAKNLQVNRIQVTDDGSCGISAVYYLGKTLGQ